VLACQFCETYLHIALGVRRTLYSVDQRCLTRVLNVTLIVSTVEVGKNPNPARKNRTRTHVLPRTKPNPSLKVRNEQEPEWNPPCKELNRT